MNEFLKMDVFFFTTTVVVLLLGVLLIIALYYIIKILKSIDHVAQNVSDESDNVRGDITVLRGKIRDEGMKVRHFMDFFMNVASRKTGTKKKTVHKAD